MENKNRYDVRFTQFYEYLDIEAEDEDEAVEIAEKEFKADMYRPIARPDYDEVEIAEEGEEYEEYY